MFSQPLSRLRKNRLGLRPSRQTSLSACLWAAIRRPQRLGSAPQGARSGPPGAPRRFRAAGGAAGCGAGQGGVAWASGKRTESGRSVRPGRFPGGARRPAGRGRRAAQRPLKGLIRQGGAGPSGYAEVLRRPSGGRRGFERGGAATAAQGADRLGPGSVAPDFEGPGAPRTPVEARSPRSGAVRPAGRNPADGPLRAPERGRRRPGAAGLAPGRVWCSAFPPGFAPWI
jgi:hypothetical protein